MTINQKKKNLLSFLFLILHFAFIYREFLKYQETRCVSGYRFGKKLCQENALALIGMLCLAQIGLTISFLKKVKKQKEEESKPKENFPKDTQPPMTSSQEIENEIQRKIKNLPSPLKEWLQENITSPKKINLVSDLVKGKSLEHWVLTKKEAPYFLIYNQKDNKFGIGTHVRDEALWYMGDYESFSKAVSEMYSFL